MKHVMSMNDGIRGNHSVLGRVIVHADLDCFYCQVEHVRLGIPKSTPLAVQQWDGVIAVNYEARKFGVKRGDRTEVAKGKCPQLQLVHVETIADDDAVRGNAGSAALQGVGVGTASQARNDRGTCKVSLQRYREASFAIMSIFQAHCRRVERASIDEAYLDLTEEAAKLFQGTEAEENQDMANVPETDLQGTAGHRVDPSNAFDRALLAGARLTAAIRRAIEEELGYTVSAGIASNKMLAKIASSRNKPNKQTVVPASAASGMLHTVPLQNVRGLGGKLGEAVSSWSKAKTATELQRFEQEGLVRKFGAKTGGWLWRICRGMDDEPVTPNLRPKSLSACKTFPPIRDRSEVLQWMNLLCKELAHRIGVDRTSWRRRATKLTLQIISLVPGDRLTTTSIWKASTSTRSRTVDIPGGAEPPTSAALVSEAMGIFDKTEHAMPCYRLALTAHEFGSLVSGKGSISSFLRASPSSETKSHEKPDSSAQREISSSVANETLVVASKTQDERCTNAERKNHEIETERGNSPPSHACSNESEEICSQCGEILPIESLREHHDFHYAQGLQEQYTRELDIQREMAAGTSNRSISNKRGRNDESKRGAQSVGGRGKSGRLSNDSSTSRIDSFFKPA